MSALQGVLARSPVLKEHLQAEIQRLRAGIPLELWHRTSSASSDRGVPAQVRSLAAPLLITRIDGTRSFAAALLQCRRCCCCC